MALCLSKIYPLAIGLQPWLGNSGIGKGGFFRLCVKTPDAESRYCMVLEGT
jgi:hypothetical protein